MKIDRLIGILMILINKEKVTASYLADHFQVSVRTIQRDIDTLTLAGIPLYADVGASGGYQLMSDYKIDKSFINKHEANILSQFLKSLEHVAPYSEVKSISNKFLNFAEEDDDLKLAIHLNPGLDSQLFKKHMNCLSKARDELLKVNIVYYNIDFTKSTRTICPHTILLYGSNWYIYGYCELRQDFRMFKLHRIVDCTITNEHFDLKPIPKPLPWEESFDQRQAHEAIVLEIDKKLQGKLPDYFGPDVCTLYEDKILVEVYFPIDEWVYSLLMSLVPHIKVLAPESLRKEFTNRLKICYEKNNYDI